MIKNMGTADKILRVALAIVIFFLIAFRQIEGIAAIILGVFAVVFVLTSFIGTCPAYLPFKFSTAKKIETTRVKR